MRLANVGVSFVVLAHDRLYEVKRENGTTYDRMIPVMSGQTEEYYAGVVDIIGYYHMVGGQRFLRIRGDSTVQAGCRLEAGNAFTTTRGAQVVRIPMGNSSEEAWQNIKIAFRNGQTRTFDDDDLMEDGINVKKEKGNMTQRKGRKVS
jgi:hypothetical protein